MRHVVAVTAALSALLGVVVARPAMPTPAPMQRETVAMALAFEAVRTVALLGRRRRRLRCRRLAAASGNERGQTRNAAVFAPAGRRGLTLRPMAVALCLALLLAGCVLLLAHVLLLAGRVLLLAGRVLLLARRIKLRIARQVRLRIAGAECRLVASIRGVGRFLIIFLAPVSAHVHAAFAAEEGRWLPELLLRRCDQAEIMLGMLMVVLGRDGIAR